jgi:hypothetical protein
MEASLWQNVPNVEKMWLLKKLGRWQAELTKLENACNWKSVCASAAAKLSGRYLASRKSDLLKNRKTLSIISITISS